MQESLLPLGRGFVAFSDYAYGSGICTAPSCRLPRSSNARRWRNSSIKSLVRTLRHCSPLPSLRHSILPPRRPRARASSHPFEGDGARCGFDSGGTGRRRFPGWPPVPIGPAQQGLLFAGLIAPPDRAATFRRTSKSQGTACRERTPSRRANEPIPTCCPSRTDFLPMLGHLTPFTASRNRQARRYRGRLSCL